MNTPLQAIFTLDYSRLGVYKNTEDRLELEQAMIDKYIVRKQLEKLPEGQPYFGLEEKETTTSYVDTNVCRSCSNCSSHSTN